MSRIIKSELYKHKIYRYYLFAAIYSVIYCLLTFFTMKLAKMAITSLESMDGVETTGTMPSYSNAMQVVADNIGMLTTLLAIIVAIIVCRDRKDDTIKNVVASGNSRFAIYFGRLTATLIAAGIFFVIQLAASFVASFLYGVEFGNPADIIVPLLFKLLFYFILTLIFYGLSSLIGNMVVSLLVNLFFTQALSMILSTASNLFHIDAIAKCDISVVNSVEIGGSISTYVPIAAAVYFVLAVILNLAAYKLFSKKAI